MHNRLSTPRRTLAVGLAGAVIVASSACHASPEPEPPTDWTQQMVEDLAAEQAVVDADGGDVHLDLNPDENTVEVAPGVTYTLSDLSRVHDANGDEALSMLVKVTNDSGDVFSTGGTDSGVNVWVNYDAAGTSATDVPLERTANGVATSSQFGAPIRDGGEAEILSGYAVPHASTEITVRLQVWDNDAPMRNTYLTGEIPPG